MIKVTRKDNESFDAMARRFRRHVINRGVIPEAKSKRFSTKEKSKNMRKASKLTKLRLGGKMQYLRKIGKLEETERRQK